MLSSLSSPRTFSSLFLLLEYDTKANRYRLLAVITLITSMLAKPVSILSFS